MIRRDFLKGLMLSVGGVALINPTNKVIFDMGRSRRTLSTTEIWSGYDPGGPDTFGLASIKAEGEPVQYDGWTKALWPNLDAWSKVLPSVDVESLDHFLITPQTGVV